MAPYPEEIDVFSAPHSRMKALVDVYSEKLVCTDFSDYVSLDSLLRELHHTFCEFKSHEQIENRYIMRKLKKRLKLLSIQDAAVCNCHSDNKLQEMLSLVEAGYACCHEEERKSFGRRLQRALQDFNSTFLPHMREEEEVFQPMLMKYFEYEELKNLKERVIQEHSKWHAYEKNTFEDAQADHKVDYADAGTNDAPSLSVLPSEVLQHVLSFLPKRDLIRVSSVSRQWYSVSRTPTLWKEIHPTAWAHGIWDEYSECHEDRVSLFYPDSAPLPAHYSRDEDADVISEDEGDGEDGSGDRNTHQREALFIEGAVRHLLPQVGHGVKKIVLGSSRGLTSGMLRSILMLCPNVTYLDVSYTPILDSAFKGLSEHGSCTRLTHLNLSGCKSVTDEGLFRLADAMATPVLGGQRPLEDVYMNEECGVEEDCFCEIEESGLWLRRRRVCSHCCVNSFCDSMCMWDRGGVLCQLAKLSLQCPMATAPSPILKTEATLLGGGLRAGGSLKYLNLSGCKEITDDGLRCLFEAGVIRDLEFLDVSGCWLLSGQELCSITNSLKFLEPENISYCDQIVDGPYPQAANGCQNLENGVRACCRLSL
ncbi:hypothetical protein JTE90_013818 [Oedothorax gibbosus]|uniref:F-box domain-containing protein n=1 Tax=Oedothorax gibbosus TaxID=931172 RepID=A0AAV6VJM4_9ARAC|nr:hypothetical protein JTE90_013818 [Oedothorax gibbosus]